MSRTVYCRYCQLPQPVSTDPRDPPGEMYCPNCGGPLARRAQTAARPTAVLWVDDDSPSSARACPCWSDTATGCSSTTDGAAGIATANQERPDVILLDVMLRGMSGFDICRKLREDPALQDTPIILLTAWDHPSVAVTGRGRGRRPRSANPPRPRPSSPTIAEVLDRKIGPPRL